MKLIKPLEDFGPLLNTVQAPSRYVGGEYGLTIKAHSDAKTLYNVGVAFPDLYEIGMSNQAVKIICNGLNKSENIRAELVFAPDVDFENLLKNKNIPLYTLATGMPLKDLDLLAFSIGYELGATEVLAMLEDGGIPPLKKDRKEGDPLVIAGGCGVTNPAPFSEFFDGIMIGEAEAGLFQLVEELALLTRKSASREEKLKLLSEKSFMWTENKASQGVLTRRAIQNDFGLVPAVDSFFPMPVIKPVQDHGVVEIMRGCPNGCRFCHAGIYYRPARVKNIKLIVDEIDRLVFDCGYREISLNSLSSADFPDVGGLLDFLNDRYKGYNVSFQLPSLKVNSLSLPILEKLSQVRKSGLTFAVETPEEMWQLSLNKEVYAQHLEAIIKEAKQKGWSTAKFYFMIGLPLDCAEKSEEKAIVDFLLDLQAKTRIQCNVNVGVFIPKAHTPYQWVKQISPEQAKIKIDYIYKNLPRGKFKLGRHNFDTTILEGLFSRGDYRAGKLIYASYKKGCRFDAWDEHLRNNMPLWEEVFSQADWDVKGWIFKDWSLDEKLPWDSVSLGPSKAFYKREWEKSLSHSLTKTCMHNCDHPCGICSPKTKVEVYDKVKVESLSDSLKNKTVIKPKERPISNIPILYRIIFNFTRMNGGEYTAYLSQVEIFHKAILRTKLPFVFTSGFNPLPRLEFANAMALGIPSLEETASAYLYDPVSTEDFVSVMNKVLPDTFKVTGAMIFPVTTLRKRESLSSGLWGSLYSYSFYDKYSARDFLKNVLKEDKFREAFFTVESDCNNLNFISSKANKEFWENIDTLTGNFVCQLPVSDKSFRTEMESFFQAKWYDIAKVTKLHTLAKATITGWTANDEENWRNNSKNFVKDTSLMENGNTDVVSFMELYKKIAKVNMDLINKRDILNQQRDVFYKEHPEILEQRKNFRKN